MATSDRNASATDTLTPLVRQLASQLRATRAGSGAVKSFPGRDAAARPELKGTIDTILRAAEQNRLRHEAVSLLKQRLEEAEALLAAQTQQLAEAESRLRASQDEARRERARAEDAERRSKDLLDRTQELLTDAGDRLAAADARADTAEGDLSYLKDFVRDRLGA